MISFRYCPRCATRLRWKLENPEDKKVQSCPNCKYTIYDNPIGAADAVIVRNNHVLLVRRMREPKPGRHDFPGGFLSGFETPAQGAIRETREEIGLRFKPKHVIGVYINHEYLWQGRRLPALAVSLLGTATGTIKTSPEVSQPKWVPLASRISMAFRYQQDTLRDLRRYLRSKNKSS